uniref:protein-tyrosine-phosphatase n=1 Tax=Eutreptiella gymnastica TaxID=73025 RepID=A0A7S4GJ16_9EUGL
MAATFDYHEMMPKGPATDRIKTSKYWNPVRDETLSMNVPNVSDLLPFAVQGNMMCAKDRASLNKAGITHILSLTRQRVPEDIRNDFAYKQIQVSDTPRTEIRHTFEDAFEFIEDARKKNGKVLIHCRAGVSRSSCASIAYLMWHYKMKLKDAYEYVKERRPIAHPNKGFLNQLITYEKYLFGETASQGINMNDLGYTIWERTEHLGLNDPLPPMDLCHLNEKMVSEEFVKRFGRKNEFCTMDAGLGGRMELHMVELYSILDFEWMDPVIRSVLGAYNAQARALIAEQQRKMQPGQARPMPQQMQPQQPQPQQPPPQPPKR